MTVQQFRFFTISPYIFHRITGAVLNFFNGCSYDDGHERNPFENENRIENEKKDNHNKTTHFHTSLCSLRLHLHLIFTTDTGKARR